MRVSTAEFISGFNDFAEQAETEPVTITQSGRDMLVLVSAGEYARLKANVEPEASAKLLGDEASSPLDASDAARTSDLWGALKHTIVFVSADIAEPTGEVWDAAR